MARSKSTDIKSERCSSPSRTAAREKLACSHAQDTAAASPQALQHELQVHQVELVMQNEELQNARRDAETALERYTDLYEFAPVGYLSLDRSGKIVQSNLAGARLLDVERARLPNKNLSGFFPRRERSAFDAFIEQVFLNPSPQAIEVTLAGVDRPPRKVRVEAIPSRDGQQCNAVLVDITDRRQTALLRQTQQIAKIGGWEYDVATGKGVWTDEVYRIYELAPDYELDSIDQEIKFYAPEARAALKSAIERAVEFGEAYDLELPFVSARGTRKWIRITGMAEVAESKARRLYGDIADITERKQAQDALLASQERFRLAMEATSDGVWDWDLIDKSGYFSPAYYRMLGFEPNEFPMTLEAWTKLVHPEDHRRAYAAVRECAENRSLSFEVEYRMKAKDGSWKWLLSRGKVFSRDDNGRPRRMTGTHLDLTRRKRFEAQLQLAASVFDNVREGIFIVDIDGKIIEVNPAFTAITGYSRDDVLGRNPRMFQSGRHEASFYAAMWQSVKEKGYWSGEIWNRRKDGAVYAEMLTICAVRDARHEIRQYVAVFTDITLAKEHQAQLERIANYDALTNLPNRLLLADRLRHAIAQTQRRKKSLAVVYLDLDGFKAVNDQYGHAVGDKLLIALAKRMREAMREGDTLARLGGDEFVAVLVDLEHEDDFKPEIARLLEVAAASFMVDDLVLKVSASIGVALYPMDCGDADQLLRHADQAMYIAKLSGKNRFHVFDVAEDAAMKSQRERIGNIREALQRNEFVLYYQPKVNMSTGEVTGAEALIRWQHPERGLLPPEAFLPVIEGHPISVKLGEWVLDQALTQVSLWRKAGLDIPVSVNVSARQLQQCDFMTRLKELLAAHPDVHPSCLGLEILETSALENLAEVAEVMHACRKIGIGVALDDFGTGYSSLTYLKRLPAELLKIDRAFVHDMVDDPDNFAIVKGVVWLATAFQLKVIAEGVETILQGERLLSLGCNLAQGFCIAKPMRGGDLPAWAARWRPDASWLAKGASAVHRDALVMPFFEAEHRQWLNALEAQLRGQQNTFHRLEKQGCYFGRWLDAWARDRYGKQAEFSAMAAIHEHLHRAAHELIAAHDDKQELDVQSRFGEVHALRDQLTGKLREMVRNKPQDGLARRPALEN